MPPDPGLERTQRWMQAFITTPAEDESAALRSAPVQAEIPAEDAIRLVRPSATLTALERISIYRNMYLARLGEALEVDYPGLLHFLGQDAFNDLIAKYVEAHPSRSYTLNRLGDQLPAFLAAQATLPKREFLSDLARLELGLTEVFDAQESPVLTGAEIAAVPPDAWESARLETIAAFRLLAFRYPVSAYLGAVDEENSFPVLRRRNTWVAAYRRNQNVHRLDLEGAAFRLLSALAQGISVGNAVQRHRIPEKQLFEWFREWTSEGLFQSVSWQ